MLSFFAIYSLGTFFFFSLLTILLFTKQGKKAFSEHIKREKRNSKFTRKISRYLSRDLTRIIFILSVSLTWIFTMPYYFSIGFFNALEKGKQ